MDFFIKFKILIQFELGKQVNLIFASQTQAFTEFLL